jgi:hypothetical protein
MDEDTSIIDNNTRNEKIKNFFIQNKRKLIISILVLSVFCAGIYSYQVYRESHRESVINKYYSAVFELQTDNRNQIASSLKEVINEKDGTYSPLALYFIIDNDLIKDKNEINNFFDILIEKTSLEKEIKNLIIYKKALYNADQASELELINILKPVTTSDSVWKSHALFLIAEYFYNKNEKKKAKDFFQMIISTQNANSEILINAQKRLNRDLSD